jgi:hypothetical protein
VREAVVLLVLFSSQLVFTDAVYRYALSGVYLALTVVAFAVGGAQKRRAFRELPEFLIGP